MVHSVVYTFHISDLAEADAQTMHNIEDAISFMYRYLSHQIGVTDVKVVHAEAN